MALIAHTCAPPTSELTMRQIYHLFFPFVDVQLYEILYVIPIVSAARSFGVSHFREKLLNYPLYSPVGGFRERGIEFRERCIRIRGVYTYIYVTRTSSFLERDATPASQLSPVHEMYSTTETRISIKTHYPYFSKWNIRVLQESRTLSPIWPEKKRRRAYESNSLTFSVSYPRSN